MKEIIVTTDMNRTRHRTEAGVIVALVVGAVLFVGAYKLGAHNQAKADAELAKRHDLSIRTALLASDDSPEPVSIPYTGVEIAAFEKGIVVDSWKREQKLAEVTK